MCTELINMKLKKCSAILSLMSFIAMLLHIGYTTFAYLAFYNNPDLTKIFAIPFITLTCFHAVTGMCSVFLLTDGTALLYPKKNISTIIQRITAALIFPLLILHLNTFALLQSTSSDGQYVCFTLLLLSETLFYAVILSHSAVSFSKALITLGILCSDKTRKKTDISVYLLCAVIFAAASFSIIKGQITMFWHF